MNFLQPWLLWGLPLLVIPIIVHLLNRMRYRTVAWPTLMFLLAATKRSTRQARLREWLILLMRALAVLALVFALARPIVGGWLGWASGGVPDTVVLALDRSASMETTDPVLRSSKRQIALQRFAEAAREFEGRSRFVLIESATLQPQEIASPTALPALSIAGPSDGAASVPALLDAALDYVVRNQCGQTEIWLATDPQKSSWQPDAKRWDEVRSRYAGLLQPVRVRLLSLTQAAPDNLSVTVREATRRRTASGCELVLNIEVAREGTAPAALPVTIVHEGARSQIELPLEKSQHSFQYALDLGSRTNAGWGWVELPADSNPADNLSYFSYPEERRLKTLVVATSADSRKILPLAAAPAGERLNQAAALVGEEDLAQLSDSALLLWQAAPPAGTAANRIRDFVEDGGVVLYLPGGAGEESKSALANWRKSDGPLANSREGKSLPLGALAVARREAPAVDGPVLALFDDGRPFLVRKPSGRGAQYALATRVDRDWSTLHEGPVLVPMLQRMLHEGGRRLGQAGDAEVGSLRASRVECLAAAGKEKSSPSPGVNAGVYRADGRLIAVNRPAEEDLPDAVAPEELRAAMGAIPYRLFEDKGGARAAMQSEIWRWFLLAMLIFLTVEAALAVPEPVRARAWAAPEQGEKFGQETFAGASAPRGRT